MKVSYDKFFKLLIDKKMKKGELCEKAGININMVGRMAKGQNVNVETLTKICAVLHCTMDDIMELLPDDKSVVENK